MSKASYVVRCSGEPRNHLYLRGLFSFVAVHSSAQIRTTRRMRIRPARRSPGTRTWDNLAVWTWAEFINPFAKYLWQ